MIKLMIVGRRAPGITRAAAHHHLCEVHGQMVVRPPADAGAMPNDYVQNHVLDGAYPGGVHSHAIERDLVTELWFDTIDHLRASTSTDYYLANLKPDEPSFVDDAVVEKMVVEPKMLVQREGGQYKLFILLTRNQEQFLDDDAWVRFDEKLLAASGVVSAVRNVVQSPPGGQAPFVEIIYEVWFTARVEAEVALLGFDGCVEALPPGSIDRSRSLALIAEEYDTARLVDLVG